MVRVCRVTTYLSEGAHLKNYISISTSHRSTANGFIGTKQNRWFSSTLISGGPPKRSSLGKSMDANNMEKLAGINYRRRRRTHATFQPTDSDDDPRAIAAVPAYERKSRTTGWRARKFA